jgi:hypothetical protein
MEQASKTMSTDASLPALLATLVGACLLATTAVLSAILTL